MASGSSRPTVVAGHAERVHRGSRTGTENLAALVWLIPCGIAFVYMCVFLVRIPHNIWEFDWISDFASGFTVPEAVVRDGTGGHTVLGQYGSYVSLWFGLLTARLPLHRQLWEIAPTLLFDVSAATIGWTVARLTTRRAGLLAALMVLVASPTALSVFMAPVTHNTTYVCVAMLGAYLVWLAKSGERGRVQTFAIPLLASIILGTCLASDLLLLSTGVLPLSLAAVGAWLLGGRPARRVALSALATVVAAIPIAWLTWRIMFAAGYRVNARTLAVTPLSALSSQAHLLLHGLERLFNGYLELGPPGILHTSLAVSCDIVMALSLVTLLVLGVRSATAVILPGRRAANRDDPTWLARTLHILYWVGSAVTACLAYLFSNWVGSAHEPFYVTVLFSVAAVVALLVRSRSAMRWLIPIGASIFFAASLEGLTDYPVWSSSPYVPHVSLVHYASDVLRLARRFDAPIGYAGYLDASSLTWSSDERVAARPVFACHKPRGADLCIFPLETVASWYVPTRKRSFLLTEAEKGLLSSLPQGLGRPLAAYRFGPMTVYIYPYDIASRFGPSTGESP